MAAQRPGRLLCVLAAAVVVLLAAAACSRGVPPARVVLKGSDSYSARPKAPAKPAGTPARAPEAQPGRTGPSAVGVVEVRKDDTLYAVSRRHRIALRDLIEVNRLAPPYLLRVGQRLRLPPPREHVVVPGDTVYGISRRYGVDMTALVRLNRIGPPYTITVGQRLRLPAATALLARPAPVRTAQPQAAKPGPGPTAKPPAPVPKPDSTAAQSSRRAPVAMPPRKPGARPAAVPAPPPRSADTFHWPLRGRILSPFGPKGNGLHNDGINIAAKRGAPVEAAENGVVVYTGNELRGFGNLVLVKHAGGWITAYAHADSILVGRGDRVRRGQVIARAGSSGNVSRPQLHFEIRRGTRAVNPVTHLAALTSDAAPSTRAAGRGRRPGPG